MKHIFIHSPEGDKTFQQNAKYCALVYCQIEKSMNFSEEISGYFELGEFKAIAL